MIKRTIFQLKLFRETISLNLVTTKLALEVTLQLFLNSQEDNLKVTKSEVLRIQTTPREMRISRTST
jgi:hypothetical protein